MADDVRAWTDKKLSGMEKHISDIYRKASKGIYKKWDEYMTEAAKKANALQTAYDEAKKSGDKDEITNAGKKLAQYKKEITLQDTQYKEMLAETTEQLAVVNKTALAYVNDQMPSIYMNNFNDMKIDADNLGLNFGIVNEATVKRMVLDGDIELPYKDLDKIKDKRWNTKQLNSSVLQGILQGESIPNIAKRIKPITNNNKNSAIRNARTMVTGAENRGLIDGAKELEGQGAVINKVWSAVGDSRTRDLHLYLDGQEVELDEPFVDANDNQIDYPGDPHAAAETVYNCRCRAKRHIIGFRKKDGRIEYVDYERTEPTLHEQQINAEKIRRRELDVEKQIKKGNAVQTIISNPDNLSSDILNIIGEKGDAIEIDKLLKTINPHFNDEKYAYSLYHQNCQRCTACFELGRRGYDVEALHFDGNYPGKSTLFNFYKYRTDNTYLNKDNNIYKINRSPKTTANSIVQAMTDWGDGSRASLSVTWRNSNSSHIVNMENINGKIFIIDAQCGKKYENIENYLSATKCAETEVLRLDIAKFKENDNFDIDRLKTLCKKRSN